MTKEDEAVIARFVEVNSGNYNEVSTRFADSSYVLRSYNKDGVQVGADQPYISGVGVMHAAGWGETNYYREPLR